MELIWEYNGSAVRKVPVSELVSIANGISMLRASIGLVEEGFARTGGRDNETYVYNLIGERLDLALKELPALVLRARVELLEVRGDEIVSRAANIFAERWLHETTSKYVYSDLQDLEYDLVDVLVTLGNNMEIKVNT